MFIDHGRQLVSLAPNAVAESLHGASGKKSVSTLSDLLVC